MMFWIISVHQLVVEEQAKLFSLIFGCLAGDNALRLYAWSSKEGTIQEVMTVYGVGRKNYLCDVGIYNYILISVWYSGKKETAR